jgi:EAL domain-containing protein (putative c-di-GMP-specific phosphodiesterase class I)/CRP-like cAMP-binding protein
MTGPGSAEKYHRHEADSQDILLARHSAGLIRRYIFPQDTILFRKGELRQCAFLIDKGAVDIIGNDEGGEDRLLCTISEGEIFGEMALIDNAPRTATAVTTKESEIFVIPRDALQERAHGLDPIVSLLISLLIERYRITRIHLPESVKQDRIGDFVSKLSKYERLPEEMMRLRNVKETRDTALREMKLEQELRTALEKKQFVPMLQPILKLPERRLAGFETLIRWQHPEKGMIMPNDFIPVAERTGVVQHLDRMMLEHACEFLPVLHKQAPGAFISVNLSGINFGTLDLVDAVAGILKRSRVNPDHINLEITESALIGDPELAQKVLEGLKNLGLSVALDDFGTGYSSLSYLHKFAIDALKIDRSFVAQLHNGQRSIDIVQAIVSLARTFKLGVIAEGVEREEDLALLNGMGCDMGQGYLFSKPLPADKIPEYIRKMEK